MRTKSLIVKFLKTATLLFLIGNGLPGQAQKIPLQNGFAHNDYWHKRPLFDALDNGYTHIEADIFYINGEMVVAHFFPFFQGNRTLEKLYLKPLADRIKKQGNVFEGYDTPVTLMIDIKTGAEDTYRALKPLLQKYSSILSSYENGRLQKRQVTIVLSGNKPYRSIKNEKQRLAFIDEDLRDVGKDKCDANVYQMASCKYSSLLNWDGNGTMPDDERRLLCSYVTKAHSMGKKVRLWASPEKECVWKQLLSCGVDLINTDELAMLRKFLITNTSVNENINLTKKARVASL
ncbi:phosphatidylinositol-specific phospholipase C/glycerophosphodiester phosphodiesterase family protein [Mucilaginibacter sp. UR6-1]|uniref:phosphatidylinositol-specific phospholipase C/glycerophosphodiester phosphodiesterase family protein n=1 Tax=Mucilaginibacter sp. UR6-1 TaxID=1435643 RepID=UPI001E35046E|nr:phosphatidylinositol-specific phospholipase C/glycerophosphodiester phosphodiesterase family protein [Mucilaginibacter sp. UR6-1]MCC8409745.1 phosphatidylinositol-specific phospholipase C/glycerophosphodiester phosphodiesterase family protein [Mucilaginibacter sp. UR6-1]